MPQNHIPLFILSVVIGAGLFFAAHSGIHVPAGAASHDTVNLPETVRINNHSIESRSMYLSPDTFTLQTTAPTSTLLKMTVNTPAPGTPITIDTGQERTSYRAQLINNTLTVAVPAGEEHGEMRVGCTDWQNGGCRDVPGVNIADAHFLSPDTGRWDSVYGAGWYTTNAGEHPRFGQNRTTLHLWNPDSTSRPAILRFRARSFATRRNLTISHGGELISRQTLTPDRERLIHERVQLTPGWNTVTLRTASPCKQLDAIHDNNDLRCVAMAVSSVRLQPVPPTLPNVELSTVDAKTPKVALIVLDGAEWKVITQLKEQDRLPHITRMIQNGVYGNFSTPRAFSPVSWTKIATGQATQDTSITGWNTQNEDGSRRMVKSTDVAHRRIWNYLNAAGVSTSVIQWLLTWPVEPVDGYMVAGPMAQSEQDIAYPSSAYNTSEIETIRHADEWRVGRMMLRKTLGETPFVALGFKRLDALQHQLWKFIEPAAFGMERQPEHDKYREQVYLEYERVDEVISRFGPEWNVILVSDSGFRPDGAEMGHIAPTYESNLNPLLKQLGYVDYEYEMVKNQRVTKIQPGSVLKWCPPEYPKNDVINATHYRFRLCFRTDHIQPQSVITRLQHITYPDGSPFFYHLSHEDGQSFLTGRFRLRDAYFNRTRVRTGYVQQPTVSGQTYYIDRALQLRLPNGSTYSLWMGPEKTGDHPPGTDGIFIASGPAFRDAGHITDNIPGTTDIAPMMLYMYDLPIPTAMEGSPQTQLFTAAFRADRQARYGNITVRRHARPAADADDSTVSALKQRLRDLGYAVK